MTRSNTRSPLSVAGLIPWLVLALLMLYSYAYFFQAPFPGFNFSTSRAQVTEIYVQGLDRPSLEIGDNLIQVGSVRWEDFRSNLWTPLFAGAAPGQTVPIVVQREGETLTIPWVYPGATPQERGYRLRQTWWIGYAFWLAGTLTLLLVRPRDLRWRLIIAFEYLTAAWLVLGTAGQWHTWASGILFRTTIWLSMPVLLHLHWIFPRSLGRLPSVVLWAGYLAATALVVVEWLYSLPTSAYSLGYLVAALGSITLLVLHALRQPQGRRDIVLLAFAVLLAVLPLLVVAFTGISGKFPQGAQLALLTLPAFPAAYFYIAFRRQLGGMELRVNRFIAGFTFFLFLVSGLIVLVWLAAAALDFEGDTFVISLSAAVLAALLTLTTYRPFERFVERRLLSIPLPPTDLLQHLSARIATSLEMPLLMRLLRDDICRSLLVRQHALVHLDEAKHRTVLDAFGLGTDQQPTDQEIPGLLAQAGQYRLSVEPETAPQPCPWARLILPLQLGDDLVGLWLLGRRDPDDFYSQIEIPILQAIAHQTAIALTNIIQADRLRALHHANIQRHEEERARLARKLHDGMLGDITALNLRLDDSGAASQIGPQLRGLAEHVRQVVHDLRPPMLTYGLWAALEGLADDLADLSSDGPEVELAVPETTTRYDPQAEQHLFRILQQAGGNALRHARAQSIRIHGRLAPDEVDLTVEDDGVGFEHGAPPDLDWLLARNHYGLANMLERAALIGARVLIDSAPGHGARVRVRWHPAHPSTSLASLGAVGPRVRVPSE